MSSGTLKKYDDDHAGGGVETPGTWDQTLLDENQPGRLFGGFFQRISEAVGATRELLYDGELRKKAVPFVLAEGGKALQEFQKGLTRNAAALGRQLQHHATGQFPSYIGRLLERTYSRRHDRVEQYSQPVSVWVGARPVHDMPQEVRTRFWYVLLEYPHVIQLLKPVCSRDLFGPSPADATGITGMQERPAQEREANGAEAAAVPDAASTEAAASVSDPEALQAIMQLSPPDTSAQGSLVHVQASPPETRTQGSLVHVQVPIVNVLPTALPSASTREDFNGDQTNGEGLTAVDSSRETGLVGTAGLQANAAGEPAGSTLPTPLAASTDSVSVTLSHDHPSEGNGLETATGDPPSTSTSMEALSCLPIGSNALTGAPTLTASAASPPQPHTTSAGLLAQTASSGVPSTCPRPPLRPSSTAPARATPFPSLAPGTTAGPLAPGTTITAAAAAVTGGVHADEDDVLNMLEAAQQQAQQQQVASAPAAAGHTQRRPSLSGFLQKVASAVDKGKAVAAGVRGSSSGRETPIAEGEDGLQQPLSYSSSQLYTAAATTQSLSLQRLSASVQGGPVPVSPPLSTQSADQQQQLQPTVSSSTPQRQSIQTMFNGADGEWELLDSPRQNSMDAGSRVPSMVQQRLQQQLDEAQTKDLVTEQVWSLMLSVPWHPVRGLVLDTPEDCRYLTLNEMTAGQEEVDDVIMRDIHRTFPEHPKFHDLGGQMELFRLLKAYSLHDLEVGYCQGMAFAAGVMLMYLPEEPAFRLYCIMMGDEGPNLRRLYLPGLEELKSELARFEQLMSCTQPALQAHLNDFGIPPVLYVSQWLMTVYASPFPPSFCAELIDIMTQDGHDAIMMRVALTIMDELAPALLHLADFEQLLTYIKVTPMEWDAGHLQQLLIKAVSHTWSGPPEGGLQAVGSLAQPLGDRSGSLPLPLPLPSHLASPVASATTPGRMLSHMEPMDAAELQLDQEIAQMVRDLKLKVPPPRT